MAHYIGLDPTGPRPSPGWGRVPTFELVPHPDHPSRAVASVFARLDVYDDRLSLIYGTSTGSHELKLSESKGSERADELWRTTCFELFVRQSGTAYLEFNFSPSGSWAAYAFGDYRQGMRPLIIGDDPILPSPPDPWTEDLGEFVLFANLGPTPPGAALGLSAVIEEADGTKSYWALAHPPGPPDFHHPACFAARLPAPPVA